MYASSSLRSLALQRKEATPRKLNYTFGSDQVTNDCVSIYRSTCLIVFTCFYIAAFATTWGPAAWVVVGEIYPLPIRAKGVALATASNWFWNCVIAVITPYMVDENEGDLKVKVFFVWGSALFLCLLFAYFFIPETKGLTLEQVDKMLEESTPATSAKWKPHDTFAHEMGMVDKIEPSVSLEEHTTKNVAGTEHMRSV